MNPKSPPKSFSRRLQLSLANARFFTFSALVHLVLVILGGSVVLIRNHAEPPDFEAGDGGLVSPESAAAQPPPAPPAADTPQFQASSPSVSAPSLAAITSSAISPSSFQMASIAPTTNIDSKLNNLATNATEKMGEKLAGMASGARGGKGQFFGSRERVVNALVGTFYDLKQSKTRKPTTVTNDVKEYTRVYREFVNKGWNRGILDEYYRSKAPLYATQVFIPDMPADEGPKAFDVEKDVQPSRWVVLYKGRITPPEDGVYHFVGFGDDVLIVRFNGQIALDACWGDKKYDPPGTVYPWKPLRSYNYGFPAKTSVKFPVGDALTIKAGQFYDVEILIGERPGGRCFSCLMVEKDGETYQKDARGNPILPPFRLADGPPPQLETGQSLPPFQANGPVWKAAAIKGGSGSALDDFFGPK